jgi:hypothetical protein
LFKASNSVKLRPGLVELKVDIGLTTIVMTSKGVGQIFKLGASSVEPSVKFN